MRPLLCWLLFSFGQVATLAVFSAVFAPSGTYYIDFTGAEISHMCMPPLGTHAIVAIPPFRVPGSDAAKIRRKIIRKVRDDFSRWPISVIEGEEHKHLEENVVVVGGQCASPRIWGIAQSVDVGDRRAAQRAVVFAERILPVLDAGFSEDELLQAVANTISHEIGHLLGFSHIAVPWDIMSPSVPKNPCMDQQFMYYPQCYVDRATICWEPIWDG